MRDKGHIFDIIWLVLTKLSLVETFKSMEKDALRHGHGHGHGHCKKRNGNNLNGEGFGIAHPVNKKKKIEFL